MLFHESKDESAWGLALAGLIVVCMAAFLGVMTGKVQPTAPVERSHPDVASPDLRGKVAEPALPPTDSSSPYPQPAK